MQASKRFTLYQTLHWGRRFILIFLIVDTLPVAIYALTKWSWVLIPWQPLSLIGIAVAFYLGFKNNSSYERLWEARKIWGGIVNASRTFTVMSRDFVTNLHATHPAEEPELAGIRKQLVHRHVAWLRALSIQLRILKAWEHNSAYEQYFREQMGVANPESRFPELQPYLTEADYAYVMSKGNKASHLLSLQSKHLRELREKELIDDFRHMEMERVVGELYALQGKSERIKNFPFPRQYATVNYFFVWLFILLLPFGMLSVFAGHPDSYMIWLSIPFSVIGSWVFYTMEMIGDYSENPFEGLYNDVPISSMARGIEIDIRQMLEETDLPAPILPEGTMHMVM